jgi:hypothetical protein
MTGCYNNPPRAQAAGADGSQPHRAFIEEITITLASVGQDRQDRAENRKKRATLSCGAGGFAPARELRI